MKMVQFVIEHCTDCKTHRLTTRHDKAKYESFASQMQESLGGASVCLINELPEAWLTQPICQAMQLRNIDGHGLK